MKKKKIIVGVIIGLIIGVLLGVGVACLVYFLTVGKVSWQEYIQNKLIPNAVLVITTLSSIALALVPIINRVVYTLSKFNKATEDVSETVKNNGKNEQEIEMVKSNVEAMKKSITNIEKIVRIGFCNTEEIVRKGFATEIEKVGKSDGKEEKESES